MVAVELVKWRWQRVSRVKKALLVVVPVGGGVLVFRKVRGAKVRDGFTNPQDQPPAG